MRRVIPDVFDDLAVGITLHDPETGEILGVNKRLEELYGYSVAQLREMTVGEYSADGDTFTQAEAVRRIRAAANGESQTFEWHVKRSDGELVWVNVRLAATTLERVEYVIAEIRDITERKRSERELEAEQSFIEQSLDSLDDIFYLLDTDGRIERWNDSFAAATGYTDEEIAEKHALEFFPADDQPEIGDAIAEVLERGISVVEADILTKDGKRVPYEFTGTQFIDAAGTLQGIIGIGRDITERKERLNTLKKQERAFRTLHETASSTAPFEEQIAELLEFGREYMGVEQGNFTRISEDTQEIVVAVGENETNASGDTIPLSEAYCRHTLAKTAEGPFTIQNAAEEGWADDPAFERLGLACYAGAPVTVDGDSIGTICFLDREPHDGEFTDIQKTYVELVAEWAGYELERVQSERTYRRLTERITSGYYAFDTDWTITYWNEAIAQRQGIPPEEVIGENFWEMFPEIDGTDYGQTLREAMESGEPQSIEFYYEPEDYWVSSQMFPDEDGLAVLSTDVTERKRKEKELERSNEKLEQFAYVASHDLQEPLRTISNYIELIADEYGEQLDEGAEEFIDTVATSSRRMQSMLNGLLDYSRVTTHGTAFEPVDTEQAVEDIVEDINLMIEEHDGTVDYGSLPTVSGDPSQIRQVFQNLVKNALEHSGSGPVNIDIRATELDDAYRFEVTDDGPGIEPDRQDEIFTIFNSSSRDQTTEQARGLGLAICEGIITRHDGTIRVESEPGAGATFVFTIKKA